MAAAEVLEQNLEESSEKLQQIIDAIELASTQMSDLSGQLESTNTSLEEAKESIIEGLETTSQELESTKAEFTSSRDEVLNVIEGLQTALGELEEKLNGGSETLDNAENEFGSANDSRREELDNNLEEVIAAFNDLAETIAQMEDSVSEENETTESFFSEFSQGVKGLQENIESVQEETEADFSEIASNVGENLKSDLNSLLEEFSSQLTDEQLGEISEGFTELTGNFEEMFNSFSQDTGELGDKLKDTLNEVLENSQDYAGEQMKSKITASFQDAIEDSVRAMMQEVVENVTMMSFGTTVTSALSPVLPFIAAAKTVTGLLAAGLSIF